eukprot:scaffold8183_cov248-Pinguiococcus_pyrenoidosus.AAC.1
MSYPRGMGLRISVDDLLNGTGDWANLQPVVRRTFKALIDAIGKDRETQTQTASIVASLRRKVVDKVDNSTLEEALQQQQKGQRDSTNYIVQLEKDAEKKQQLWERRIQKVEAAVAQRLDAHAVEEMLKASLKRIVEETTSAIAAHETETAAEVASLRRQVADLGNRVAKLSQATEARFIERADTQREIEELRQDVGSVRGGLEVLNAEGQTTKSIAADLQQATTRLHELFADTSRPRDENLMDILNGKVDQAVFLAGMKGLEERTKAVETIMDKVSGGLSAPIERAESKAAQSGGERDRAASEPYSDAVAKLFSKVTSMYNLPQTMPQRLQLLEEAVAQQHAHDEGFFSDIQSRLRDCEAASKDVRDSQASLKELAAMSAGNVATFTEEEKDKLTRRVRKISKVSIPASPVHHQ